MSRSSNKTIIATMGDPAGIGPEVLAKALDGIHLPKNRRIVLIGNQDIWHQVARKSQFITSLNVSCIHVAHNKRHIHKPGVPTAESGKDSLLYLEKAVDLIKNDPSQVLVTAPVSKESICHYIPDFKGHTTYLANAFSCKNVEMLFVSEHIRLVLVTRHVPLKDVAELATSRKIVNVITASCSFLTDRFKIKEPKVAVLGLNPHAGEGGYIGTEEIGSVIPAIKKVRARGVNVFGPFPADTFFEPHNCHGYDLVVAMYHDQGLIALKALYFNQLVNLTIGLPFIRTSPVHGTAFGIAGRDQANEGSMRAAIELAFKL